MYSINYPSVPGIYCFLNTINNKRYIGKAFNIRKRYLEHISSLKSKKHINKYFQNAWYRYGEKHFQFLILEECQKEILSDRERYYIKLLETNNRRSGYNLSEGGDGGDNRRGRPLTKEQQEKQTKNTPRGSSQHSSKLTESSVLKIKFWLSALSNGKLAKAFNVSESAIWKIRTGRSWKHV